MGVLSNIFSTTEETTTSSSTIAQDGQRRKYNKRNTIYRFSDKKQMPLPQKAGARDTSRFVSKSTVQGRLTSKILTLNVGEMFTLTFNSDPSEVSSRLTVFRKRFPEVKITTRRIGENTIGIWRV